MTTLMTHYKPLFAGGFLMADHDKWYPFYFRDFADACVLMSEEEELLYRRMLDKYWHYDGQFPAKDLKSLATVSGYQLRKFKRVWPKVADKFPEIDGKLCNPRMDKELQKARLNVEAARKNGRKGGRPANNPALIAANNPTLNPDKSTAGCGSGPYQDISILNTSTKGPFG